MTDEQKKSYDVFVNDGFLPINKDAYKEFIKYDNYSVLQEMSAVIICTWSSGRGLYKVIEGYMCGVYFYSDRSVYFSIHRPSVVSAPLSRIIDIVYELSLKASLPSMQVKFIEEKYLHDFLAIDGYDIRHEFFENDSEYAYKMADFINLEGNINKNKRQRLSKCQKGTNFSIRPLAEANFGICLEIEKIWCANLDCSSCKSFAGCEKKAMEAMSEFYDEKRHSGIVIYKDDKPVGYAIGEIINKNLAFVYLGKSVEQDCFVYALYLMAKEVFSEIEYMNFNEDMGNMGLRMFKRNFGHYELWKKYICTFTKTKGNQ